MAKYEKEIKILNIKVDDIENKLKSIGAVFKNEKTQKIYTYDIPTLYYRYLEIKELLKTSNNLLYNTTLIKLNTLLAEIEDLISNDRLSSFYKENGIANLTDVSHLPKEKILEIVNSDAMIKLFENNLINPNKWLRLRQSNDKVELTVKHVFEKEESSIQKVLETEINVSSLSEANLLLESVGLARRNYQEKIRKSYTYKNAEIEIDIWPMLEPYMEIECDEEETINELINLLELNENRIVSVNTSHLYKEKGIDIQNISELKFDK